MANAGRMRLAVIDAFERPIVAWDDARLAQQILVHSVAAQITPPKKRFWQRQPKAVSQVPVETAVMLALEDLTREVARL